MEDSQGEDEALISRVKANCEATVRACDRAMDLTNGMDLKNGAFVAIKEAFQDMLRVCEIADRAMYLGFYVPAALAPRRNTDRKATNAAAGVFAEASTFHRDVPHTVKAARRRKRAAK